jgi:hypothetical protein
VPNRAIAVGQRVLNETEISYRGGGGVSSSYAEYAGRRISSLGHTAPVVQGDIRPDGCWGPRPTALTVTSSSAKTYLIRSSC